MWVHDQDEAVDYRAGFPMMSLREMQADSGFESPGLHWDSLGSEFFMSRDLDFDQETASPTEP